MSYEVGDVIITRGHGSCFRPEEGAYRATIIATKETKGYKHDYPYLVQYETRKTTYPIVQYFSELPENLVGVSNVAGLDLDEIIRLAYVKSTAISRAFYKGRIKEEKDGKLYIKGKM